MSTRPDHVAPPREIAPGIFWLGACVQVGYQGQTIHSHISTYLIVGAEKTLMVDTGYPEHWDHVERHLDEILGDRQLDWIAPTHPELAHAGNLNRLLAKYEGARAIGRLTDYHLFYPEVADRLTPWPLREPIDLGGGYEVTLLEAPIKDLPSTQWLYESSQQVLWVADGFAYIHPPKLEAFDEPAHFPGQCRMLSNEIPELPTTSQAVFVTRNALSWTQFVDVADIRREVAELMQEFPPRIVCPSHGNVIVDLDVFEPLIFGAYRAVHDAYQEQGAKS